MVSMAKTMPFISYHFDKSFISQPGVIELKREEQLIGAKEWKYHGLHHRSLLVYLSETATQILSASLHNIAVEEGAFVIASIFGIPHEEPPPKVFF